MFNMLKSGRADSKLRRENRRMSKESEIRRSVQEALGGGRMDFDLHIHMVRSR